MKIYTVNPEELLMNFSPNVRSIEKLNELQKEFIKQTEEIKTEMQQIITSAQSGLIVNPAIQEQNINRFKELQVEGSQLEVEFREKYVSLQEAELTNNLELLMAYINEWALTNGYSYIFNKNHMLVSPPENELTEQIKDSLKIDNLYYEEQKEDIC